MRNLGMRKTPQETSWKFLAEMAGQEENFDGVPVEAPTVEIKLFGKWSSDDVHVNDISLAVSWWRLQILCQVAIIESMLSHTGLHYSEGEGFSVFAPYCWAICS